MSSSGAAAAGHAKGIHNVTKTAPQLPVPVEQLSTRDYLSIIGFRSLRCSALLLPYVFGLFTIDQMAYSLVRLRARYVLSGTG